MRDIKLEDTFRHQFTTRAFATGVPTVLAGTPVLSVLEENNATPITAGVTVSVDRASVVGLNEVTVIATAANGYEVGKSYGVYISTGTVGGVSVIGEVIHNFTIELAPVNWARVTAPTTAVDLSGTDIQLVDTTSVNADMRGTDGVDTATMRGTDGVDTATMRGTDSAALASVLGTPVGADISADIAAVKADTVIPEKNVAFSNIYALMVDSTDHVTAKTSLTLTVQRSLDGGAFISATGTAAEISNGMYQFDATAADMNGDTITFRFSGTAADDTFLTIVTR